MPEPTNDWVRYRILEILYGKATQETDWGVTREELRKALLLEDKLIDFNVGYLHQVKLAQILLITRRAWEKIQITGKGIDVIEHKPQFSDEYPFLKTQIVQVHGDVNAPIIQATDSQVNFSQQVNDAFKRAYSMVEGKNDIQPEQKEEIKKNLKDLQEELQIKKLTWAKFKEHGFG